ncbi:MAG: hypothetical protein SOR72_06230, partial [Hornefia sp.]|nr:hypothetical protein [Hornefia sp.]
LLKQALDNTSFPLSHWFWFVNFFFSVCHNKRPPMILIFYHRRPLYCSIYRDFFTGSDEDIRKHFMDYFCEHLIDALMIDELKKEAYLFM